MWDIWLKTWKTIAFNNINDSYVPTSYAYKFSDLWIDSKKVWTEYIIWIRCYTKEESALEKIVDKTSLENASQTRWTKVQFSWITIVKKDPTKPFWKCTTNDSNWKVWMKQMSFTDKTSDNTTCSEATKDEAIKFDDQVKKNAYICYATNLVQFSEIDQSNSWLKCEKNKYFDIFTSQRPSQVQNLKAEAIQEWQNIKIKVSWDPSTSSDIIWYNTIYSWDSAIEYRSYWSSTKDTSYTVMLWSIWANISNFKYYARVLSINSKWIESAPVSIAVNIAKNSSLNLSTQSISKINEWIVIDSSWIQTYDNYNQNILEASWLAAIYIANTDTTQLRWSNSTYKNTAGYKLYISDTNWKLINIMTLWYNNWLDLKWLPIWTSFKLTAYELDQNWQIASESKWISTKSKAQLTSIWEVKNLKYSVNDLWNVILNWDPVEWATRYIVYVYVNSWGNNDPWVYNWAPETNSYTSKIPKWYTFKVVAYDWWNLTSKWVIIETK